MCDSELLYLIIYGDNESYSKLMIKYRPMFKKYAYSYHDRLRNSGEVNDLEQIAIIALEKAVKSFDKSIGVSFSRYYRLIMERLAANYLRQIYNDKNRLNQEALSYDNRIRECDNLYYAETIYVKKSEFDPKLIFEAKETNQNISKVINELSVQWRQVYTLWHTGHTYREISEITGLSNKKIDNILQGVKKKIRAVNL